jgi:hypothetical protein
VVAQGELLGPKGGPGVRVEGECRIFTQIWW